MDPETTPQPSDTPSGAEIDPLPVADSGPTSEIDPPGAGGSALARRSQALGRGLRVLRMAQRKARADELPTRSAALAFVTALSLIPLLAALSYFGAAFFSERQGYLVELLVQVLPYTEAAVTDALKEFLEQSGSLRGVGLALFLITGLGAMGAIENMVNQIWEVAGRRSFRSRLNSFVLLLVSGPLLIGVTYSGLFLLRQHGTFVSLADSLPAQLLPFLVTLLGLTVLYWQVPSTQVRFSAALAGGIAAALLIEVLRLGFGFYADRVQQVSVVYGSFGLALLFMISIQAAWGIVLFGVECSYCVQNYENLARPRRSAAVAEGAWLALGALVFSATRLRNHEPSTPGTMMAKSLGLLPEELRQTIAPLLEASLLRPEGGNSDAYLLSCDPSQLTVAAVFELYEGNHATLLQGLPGAEMPSLAPLRGALVDARGRALDGDPTILDLLPTTRGPMTRAE
ncbi:MAG: YihY/virulence factor BrkB family protein [Acidobacteriota bacterium]